MGHKSWQIIRGTVPEIGQIIFRWNLKDEKKKEGIVITLFVFSKLAPDIRNKLFYFMSHVSTI